MKGHVSLEASHQYEFDFARSNAGEHLSVFADLSRVFLGFDCRYEIWFEPQYLVGRCPMNWQGDSSKDASHTKTQKNALLDIVGLQ